MDHMERERAAMPSSVRIGGMQTPQLLRALRAQGVRLNEAGETLLANPRFTVLDRERVVAITLVSVADLEFEDGATYEQLVARAGERGLEECPLELGPHLRLQYLQQPGVAGGPSMTYGRQPPGAVTIASSPLDAADATPKGFYLRRVDEVPWLRGYRASPDHRWCAEDLLVFCCRGAGANDGASS